jgi:hypothetical protein
MCTFQVLPRTRRVTRFTSPARGLELGTEGFFQPGFHAALLAVCVAG